MGFTRELVAAEGVMLLSSVIASIVHEGGHALAMVATRMHLRMVSIGMGPAVIRLRFGRAWLVVRALPFSGFCMAPPVPPGRRGALLLVYGAGILANLIFLAGVALAAPAGADPVILLACVLPHGLFALLTAIPMNRTRQGVARPSDGLQIWRLLFRPSEDATRTSHAQLLRLVVPVGDLPELSPDTPEIIYQVARRDRFFDAWAARDASDVMREVLARERLPVAEKAFVLTFLISNHLLLGAAATPAELDLWSRQALDFSGSAAFQVTRAGVLAAIGHPVEAAALLRSLLDAVETESDRIVCHAYLAQALARTGDCAPARDHLRTAREMTTGPSRTLWLRILKRVETDIDRGVEKTATPVPPPVTGDNGPL